MSTPATKAARLRKWPRRLLRLATASALLLLLAVGLFHGLDELYPLPAEGFGRYGRSPTVEAADGTPMHTGLGSTQDRILPLPLDAISPHLKNAVVASEDRRFFEHGGVDCLAIARAALRNAQGGTSRQGASTITMQLARLIDPQPRTFAGKLVQAFRALQLEKHHAKAFLLTQYLNLVPLGGNLRGVGAASEAWFGKRALDLSASEAALLVSMLPAPSRFSPLSAPAVARKRRDRVLDAMYGEGMLDIAAWHTAKGAPLALRRSPFPDFAPHAWLRVGDGACSIDPAAQRAVQKLAGGLEGVDGLGILLIDNDTAAVCALVGSRRPDASLLDATKRPRSAGSTFKPLLYALAFDLGLAAPETMLLDLPWRGPAWAPRNFDHSYRGPVPAGEALAASYNLPAIRLAARLPDGSLARLLRQAGCQHVRRPQDGNTLDLALGTDDVTPFELAGAYLALAHGGLYRRPWLAEAARPTDYRGVRVCSPGAAALVTRALADPSRARPQGAPAQGLAWKTGTSSRRRDAWAAGYTRRYTAVVWRGRLDGRPDASLVGAFEAAPLLFAVLQSVDPSPSAFDAPADLVPVEVCAETGLARGPACGHGRVDQRPRTARPLRPCAVHRLLPIDKETGHLCCSRCAERHETVTKAFALYTPQEAAWRRKNGRAVEGLPRHHPDCADPLEPDEMTPQILSPPRGRILRVSEAGTAEVVVRVASAQPDETLRLLLDGRLVGAIRPGVPFPLSLGPGRHTLSALSERGAVGEAVVQVRGR